mmetsp:Transcript_76288/g.182546  ORF Transcript_76288/g.182546 Transcript_76288/m.182546 type:complete len:323 (+) Transcript_76288:53-1021(+)
MAPPPKSHLLPPTREDAHYGEVSESLASFASVPTSASAVSLRGVPLEEGFDIKATLGEGRYGTVSEVVRKGSKEHYAVKVMESGRDSESEFKVLAELKHPNIVGLHEAREHEGLSYLVLDLCKGGTLMDWLTDRFERHFGKEVYQRPSSKQIGKLLWQILDPVRYLHFYCIAHRDIKPQNVLLVTKGVQFPQLKLADFNLACKFSKGHKLSSRCGSLMYLAPEVLRRAYTERCDIWGIGVTFQDLVTGEALWQGQQDQEIEKLILHSKPHLRSCHWRMQSQAARDLFLQLMLPEDQGRPSARKALESSFVSRRFGQSCCAVS